METRTSPVGSINFWLGGSLQISAEEQIEFLRKFYTEEFPLSKSTYTLLKEMLVVDEGDSYRLSAKTGGGTIGGKRAIGWYVGYVESKGNIYYFAFNMEGPSLGSLLKNGSSSLEIYSHA